MRSLSSPEDLLLTMEAMIAAQAQRRVVSGLEMGTSSYYPDLSAEEALRYRVVNYELLVDYVQGGIPKVILDTDGQPLTNPENVFRLPRSLPNHEIGPDPMGSALQANYALMREFPNFLKRGNTLRIYLRKEPSPPPS